MKIVSGIENLETRIELVLFDKRLIEEDEHIDIKSSNRYFNFWYGIAEIKGTTQLYGFSLNLDNGENPVVYRIFGNIETNYGEKEIEENNGKNKGVSESYIYEILSPGDILMISRQEDSFTVAENKDGKLHIRKVKLEEDNGN